LDKILFIAEEFLYAGQMQRILFAWIGQTDLNAASGESSAGTGPIARAVAEREFERIVLLSNYRDAETDGYMAWLKARTGVYIKAIRRKLSCPTNFGEIYEAVVSGIEEVLNENRYSEVTSPKNPTKSSKKHSASLKVGVAVDTPALAFHLSPGTPAMAAVWIIVAKTRFPAELIESSREKGVRTVSFPFDISADFIPDLLRRSDRRLQQLSEGLPSESTEFADIVYRSPQMKQVIAKAWRVAPRSIPVLLAGESGTGKELLARAIHRLSPRREKAFIPVNCGAIPMELVESELFGYEKGAFTGADRSRQGHFEAAHNGTLFLDEIAELSLPAQVKLLRVLQESEVTPLGASRPRKVDVRVLAATNRNLPREVADGRFREDLYYRLAVVRLKLPPLRERSGDIGMLIDALLARINEESRDELGYKDKHLSAAARNLLFQRKWPGNIRELLNTLRGAALWSSGPIIEAEDIREALMAPIALSEENVLNRVLGNGLNLKELLTLVARHYLERALKEASGNKTVAARLLGLPSYQTLSNWLKRYGMRIPLA
jgi:DNA-binding NtrC family response regulator